MISNLRESVTLPFTLTTISRLSINTVLLYTNCLCLLSVNSPSGATKRYIYFCTYILKTLLKDYTVVLALDCLPLLIRESVTGLAVTENQM